MRKTRERLGAGVFALFLKETKRALVIDFDSPEIDFNIALKKAEGELVSKWRAQRTQRSKLGSYTF